jgi:hypothetical protein
MEEEKQKKSKETSYTYWVREKPPSYETPVPIKIATGSSLIKATGDSKGSAWNSMGTW